MILFDYNFNKSSNYAERTVHMEEIMAQEQEVQPVRTRRKRRPAWQRTLLKYWPPIRFGLLVLNLLAFVTFLLCLIFT